MLTDAHKYAQQQPLLLENVFSPFPLVDSFLHLIPIVQRTASATLVKPRRVSQLESVKSFHSIVIPSRTPKEPVLKPLVFAIQSPVAKSTNLPQQTAQFNLHLANPSSSTPRNQDVARLSPKFVLDLILARLTLAIKQQELASQLTHALLLINVKFLDVMELSVLSNQNALHLLLPQHVLLPFVPMESAVPLFLDVMMVILVLLILVPLLELLQIASSLVLILLFALMLEPNANQPLVLLTLLLRPPLASLLLPNALNPRDVLELDVMI